MKKAAALWKKVLPYFWITLGCAVYALGFNWFFVPNQIAYGGVTGIAQIINRLFGWPPIGVLIIAINIPLFLAGWKLLGRRLFVLSLVAMTLSSVFIDILSGLYTFPPMEPMLACLYGGVTIGFSTGLLFLQGATTGGSDIAARLLKLKLSWLPMGRVLLIIDLAVVIGGALAFGRVNSALYGAVALYASAVVVDWVIYGTDSAKVAYIISKKHLEIASAIGSELGRGATILHGEGFWSREDRSVLLCAIKSRQVVELKRMVQQMDPEAFLIVCDAHEVLGYGFHKKHQL